MEPRVDTLTSEAILQHAQFVRGLARKLLGEDPHAAEDLAQEALLKFVQDPPHSRLDPRAWFARVLRNLAHNQRRSRRNRDQREQIAARSESTPAADEPLRQAAVLRSVVDAVLALEEPYRATILARYYSGHEPARIARETDTPLPTVKSRLSRAHRQLRERLDRSHGSRDAWGLALATLVGKPATALLGGAPLLVVGAAALLLCALAWNSWQGQKAPEIATAVRDRPAATGQADPSSLSATPTTPAPSLDSRQPMGASLAETQLVLSGRMSHAGYAPLALEAGPAAGVTLQARLLSTAESGEQLLAKLEVQTGTDGRFRIEFPRVPSQVCKLSLSAQADRNWRGLEHESMVDAQERERTDIELVRVAHGLVEGRVVDPHGVSLAGIALRMPRDELLELPEREVASDAEGGFRLASADLLPAIKLLQPRWALLGVEPAKALATGGAEGLRVIVARGAGLRLRIEDSLGIPVSGVRVRVGLAAAEASRAQRGPGGDGPIGSAVTDDSGLAVLDGLWAGHKLEFRLDWMGTSTRSAGARGGELLFGGAAMGGAPIVLLAGEERELSARWRGLLHIDGEVRRKDSEPAGDIEISVFDQGAADSANSAMASTRSDVDGSFHFDLRTRELVGPLLILALESTRRAAPVGGALGYVGESNALVLARGELELDPAQAREGRLEARLRLEELSSIRGRVLEADGSPVKNPGNSLDLSCERSIGAAALRQPRIAQPRLRWSEDGSFEFSALREGNYDLGVAKVHWPTFYSWHHSTQHVRGVPAGTQGLQVVLAEEQLTRIHARIVGATPRASIALRAKLIESASDAPIALASRNVEVFGVAGWPRHATQRFGGISGGEDALGRWSLGFDEVGPSVEFELPPVDPGVYAFGLQAFGQGSDVSWFPQASTPLRYESGEYTIVFHVVASARLEGTLSGEVLQQRVAVQLVDETGARVPLADPRGFGRPEFERELDALGNFCIENAPVGRFLLRVGTLEELLQQRPRQQLPIEILAKENQPLVLRW